MHLRQTSNGMSPIMLEFCGAGCIGRSCMGPACAICGGWWRAWGSTQLHPERHVLCVGKTLDEVLCTIQSVYGTLSHVQGRPHA